MTTTGPLLRAPLADAWYKLIQSIFRLILMGQGGLRVSGLEHVPKTEGALLVSNHASFLDVLAIGVAVKRPLNYVARSSLFFPPLGAMIRSVGAFPIEREGVGKQGLIETIKRVQAGRIVTLFPEGTRTHDGRLQPLKPGIAVLVARANVPVLPVGVAGTFASWPRHRARPRPHALRVHVGPLIGLDELSGLDRPAITTLIHDRIAACMAEAERLLERDLNEL